MDRQPFAAAETVCRAGCSGGGEAVEWVRKAAEVMR
jgi:hypothetical protein